MNTPPIQRYEVYVGGFDELKIKPDADGEWITWEDHAPAISDALKRAAASESAMARTLAMDEAEISAPLRKLLDAMTARAEKAEESLMHYHNLARWANPTKDPQ